MAPRPDLEEATIVNAVSITEIALVDPVTVFKTDEKISKEANLN